MQVTIPQIDDVKQWVGDNVASISLWSATVVVVLVLLWLTSGTPYHQLMIGIIASGVSLLVVMLLFEGIWRLAIKIASAATEDANDRQR